MTPEPDNPTPRRRATDAAPLSTLEYSLIVESSPDAIITMNQRGLITSWNPRAESLFGWTAAEVVGRPLVETIIPHEYREAHERGLDRYLFDGTGPVLGQILDHLSGLHKDGHTFPIELCIAPARQFESNVTFLGFVRDISPLKRSHQQLRDALADLLTIASRLEALPAGEDAADDQGLKAMVALAKQRAQHIDAELGPGSVSDDATPHDRAD